MQMELSHKRARVELERAASTSARNYEVGSAGSTPRPALTVGSKSPPWLEPRCSLPSWPLEAAGRLSGVSWVPSKGNTRRAGCRALCLRRRWWALSAGRLVALSARVGIQVWQECQVA